MACAPVADSWRPGEGRLTALPYPVARAMEDTGAKVSEIQARLGHERLETTGRYLAHLRSGENPYLARLSKLFGMDPPADSGANDDVGGK
jgi:integrase